MIVVLFCLAVASLLMMVQIKSLLNTARVERHRVNQIQAYAMAGSGIDRATVRLAQSLDYEGEVWDIPSHGIVGTGEGRVTISIKHDGRSTTIEALATYPVKSSGQTTVRRLKQIEIEQPASQNRLPEAKS